MLRYDRCGWGSSELTTLSPVLPMCAKLTTLHLEHNALGAPGLLALVGVISRGALPMLRELHLADNKQVGDWRAALLQLAEAVSPRQLALSRLHLLNLDDCRIGHHAFFYLCRGLRRGALPALTRLQISGNGLENSGVEPLAHALKRGALPSLRIVTGIPRDGMQTSDARSLLQLKHLRELSMRIDSDKDDAARRSGTAIRQVSNNREVVRLERQIRDKQEALFRHRGKQL